MAQTERSYRTPAIILKRRNFGEADRLLTVLTPTRGKVDVIAKGARKATSTKTGHVELFTHADMLIHRGRDLDIATQVEMIAPFLKLREDLQCGAYANYVGELLDRFTTESDEQSDELFDLLVATLERLCNEEDSRLVIRYYELQLLNIVGFRPELSECVFTHEPLQPEDQYFSYAEGGVVSPAAAKFANALTPLSLTTLKILRHLQRSTFETVRVLNIPVQTHNEVERLVLGYITYLLERRLQSVDFIRRIRN